MEASRQILSSSTHERLALLLSNSHSLILFFIVSPSAPFSIGARSLVNHPLKWRSVQVYAPFWSLYASSPLTVRLALWSSLGMLSPLAMSRSPTILHRMAAGRATGVLVTTKRRLWWNR